MMKPGTSILNLVVIAALMQLCLQPSKAVRTSNSQPGANNTGTPIPEPTPPSARTAVGYVSGTLLIKNLKSDIYLDCKSLEIEARQVGGSQNLLGKATAYGDIGKKACRYSIGAMRASTFFQLSVLKPKAMEGKCTQEKFVADGTLPLKLKPGEKLFRNITIQNISCIVVK